MQTKYFREEDVNCFRAKGCVRAKRVMRTETLTFFSLMICCSLAEKPENASSPNIIIMLMDDVSYFLCPRDFSSSRQQPQHNSVTLFENQSGFLSLALFVFPQWVLWSIFERSVWSVSRTLQPFLSVYGVVE